MNKPHMTTHHTLMNSQKDKSAPIDCFDFKNCIRYSIKFCLALKENIKKYQMDPRR